MWELLMNWYLHTFTQFFIQFPYKKGLNLKLKYWNWLFVIRSLLFEYSNIIQYFKKDRIRIRISLFGLLLFEYSNNELFVATLDTCSICICFVCISNNWFHFLIPLISLATSVSPSAAIHYSPMLISIPATQVRARIWILSTKPQI